MHSEIKEVSQLISETIPIKYQIPIKVEELMCKKGLISYEYIQAKDFKKYL